MHGTAFGSDFALLALQCALDEVFILSTRQTRSSCTVSVVLYSLNMFLLGLLLHPMVRISP